MNFLIYLYFVLNTMMCTETYTVKLGDTKVHIIKTNGKGKTLVHVHENEVTALAAARLYVVRKGGTLITLKHSGQRNIVFHLKGLRYEFDPNRIFTNEGIRKTLHKYGHYSQGAYVEVKKLATKILCLLPKTGKIVAVHNNRDYSIKEYFPKHSLAADIMALYYRPNSNYRNFYFVTKKQEYNRLKSKKFNVALQAKKPQNDGSLSYYLGKKNYINIEAAYGALNAQLKMLRSA
ncbi:MAG: protein tyrosine phosphatase [Tatlockia sp.]|nr:protein tyrosine phosphatase [Tatlockia sp.]